MCIKIFWLWMWWLYVGYKLQTAGMQTVSQSFCNQRMKPPSTWNMADINLFWLRRRCLTTWTGCCSWCHKFCGFLCSTSDNSGLLILSVTGLQQYSLPDVLLLWYPKVTLSSLEINANINKQNNMRLTGTGLLLNVNIFVLVNRCFSVCLLKHVSDTDGWQTFHQTFKMFTVQRLPPSLYSNDFN